MTDMDNGTHVGGGVPAELEAQFNALVGEKLAAMTEAEQASWWECFVQCLAKENPAITDCLMGCAITCRNGVKKTACLACILGCGGLAWEKILECAGKCAL